METYRQTFDNIYPKRSKSMFAYHIFAGIVYFAIGVAYYYRNSEDILIVIWLLFSIAQIVIAFFHKYRNDKFFIEFNDNGIQANISTFKTININWSEIKEIEINPLNIVFQLKSDSKEILSLSASSYASVLNIKAKLHEFAKEKGIKMV